MRVELLNGHSVICGHIYSEAELEVGQQWAQADGTNRVVVIRGIEDGQVLYGDYGCDTTYSKDCFSFQCRFCRVVDK